jgi:hypothetical protein
LPWQGISKGLNNYREIPVFFLFNAGVQLVGGHIIFLFVRIHRRASVAILTLLCIFPCWGVLSNALGLKDRMLFSAGNKRAGSRYQHLSKSISLQRQIAD